MLRSLAAILAAALALAGCSERPVDEPGESHRHLAEDHCADWCPWWTSCEPALFDWPVEECREGCEGDEWWDWRDECGHTDPSG